MESYLKMLVIVDKNDKILSYKAKKEIHQLPGVLHRAFSIFIFNKKNELLLQKRSKEKTLWPLYWSNSCCSHPIKGEEIKKAAQKRLKEELGLTINLKFIGKLTYEACFKDKGCEKEVTHIFVGQDDGLVKPNKKEVAAIKWIPLKKLRKDIKINSDEYSPWLKKIIKKFAKQLDIKSGITDNPSEVFEIVDLKGKIIGKAKRKEVHSNKKLIHKAVGLVIFDKKGRILMQKRSQTKDLYPGIWSVSASGHVDVGEKENKAILREAKEEIGLQLKPKDIRFLNKSLVRSAQETELMVHFYTKACGPFKFNKQEIQKLTWFSRKEILKTIKDKKIKLTPCTQALFKDKEVRKTIFG